MGASRQRDRAHYVKHHHRDLGQEAESHKYLINPLVHQPRFRSTSGTAIARLPTGRQATINDVTRSGSTEMIRLLTDAEGDGLWYVLHTKPRQEKILSQDLAARKIRHFLPMIVRVRHYGRRKIQVEEPLFPGYLFLRGNAEDTYVADRTHRVAQILTVSDQLRLQYDLRNIALALEKRAPLNPYPYLQSGTWVEVTSGPFQGVQGVVESQTGADRLVIGVEILGQAVSIQLNGASVHALDASAPTANPTYRRQAPQPAETFNGLSSAPGALHGTERLTS